MSTFKRFQIDLTDEELNSIDRLGSLAGLRTKKEVMLSALTLLKWAARETMMGRMVCSVDETTNAIKQFELPALCAIADSRPIPLTRDEARERLSGPSRPRGEFASEVKGVIDDKGVLEKGSGRGVFPGLDSSAGEGKPVG
jgi:hypothetical protein